MNQTTKTYVLMTGGMLLIAAIIAPVLIFSMSDFEIVSLPDGCPETAYVQVGDQTLALPRRDMKRANSVPCSASLKSPHKMTQVDIKNLAVCVPMLGREEDSWDIKYKLRITPYNPNVIRPAQILNNSGPDKNNIKKAFAKADYKFPNLEFSLEMGLLALSGEPLLVSGCKNLTEVMRCSFDFVWQEELVVEVIASPFAPRYRWVEFKEKEEDIPVFEPYNPSEGATDPVAELEREIESVRRDVSQGLADAEELEMLEDELADLKLSAYEERAEKTMDPVNVANMYGLEYVQNAAIEPMRVIYIAADDFIEDAAK